MAERSLYLFCYDISCPRRLKQVHRLLCTYRVAGKKSVFECLMTLSEVDACVATLRETIDPAGDRVHVLALDPRLPREGWGRASVYDGGALVVV